MSRATIILRGAADRARAAALLAKAPAGTRLEFKAARRSIPQNSLLWSLLSEVAAQVEWHGMKLRPDDWKTIFMAALNAELRLVPNIEGNGFVNLGRSSSDLTKQEMSELIELVAAFGANHGVTFQGDRGEHAA